MLEREDGKTPEVWFLQDCVRYENSVAVLSCVTKMTHVVMGTNPLMITDIETLNSTVWDIQIPKKDYGGK